jgi:hypothetical protein
MARSLAARRSLVGTDVRYNVSFIEEEDIDSVD